MSSFNSRQPSWRSGFLADGLPFLVTGLMYRSGVSPFKIALKGILGVLMAEKEHRSEYLGKSIESSSSNAVSLVAFDIVCKVARQ